MLAASGEEASDFDDEDDASSTGTSTGTSSSIDGDKDGETTSVQLKSLIRNVSGGCGGIGQVLRRWSCNRAAARRAGAGGRGKGGRGGARAGAVEGKDGSVGAMRGGGEAPRWVPDDEKEACMLCDRK